MRLDFGDGVATRFLAHESLMTPQWLFGRQQCYEYYSWNGMKNFVLLKGGQNYESQGSVCSSIPCRSSLRAIRSNPINGTSLS